MRLEEESRQLSDIKPQLDEHPEYALTSRGSGDDDLMGTLDAEREQPGEAHESLRDLASFSSFSAEA